MGLLLRLTVLVWLAGIVHGPAPICAAVTVPAGTSEESTLDTRSAPVVVDGTTLFRVHGISAFPAEKRARAIADRIVQLAANPSFSLQTLRQEVQPAATLIMADGKLVMMVTEGDAHLEGTDRAMLARSVIMQISDAINRWREDRHPATLRHNTIITVAATAALILFIQTGGRLFRRLRASIERAVSDKIHDLTVREFRVFQARQLRSFMGGLLSLLWLITVLAAGYMYLETVLSRFPWTRGLAANLAEMLTAPLRIICLGLVRSIPNLGFLIVLFILIRYALKMIKHFFTAIEDGHVVLPDFEPDWALPTYRIVRLLLIAFALVVAYPYIPGSGTDAFKGVSIFVGVIFSLGSSSLIGNFIAGYTMTYRRAFKIGDRVRIGDYLGDVEQVRMLVSHLRTPKNELVVIPNSVILAREVINYSTLAHEQGIVLHTTVGIGYETPWRQVEAMLLLAASRTGGLRNVPPPFVLQTNLGDFCVTYELNAYCDHPERMIPLYTDLHRNILDVFNEYGVQIMTPSYEADPESPKTVPRDQWYAAPAETSSNTPHS